MLLEQAEIRRDKMQGHGNEVQRERDPALVPSTEQEIADQDVVETERADMEPEHGTSGSVIVLAALPLALVRDMDDAIHAVEGRKPHHRHEVHMVVEEVQ